MGNLIVFRRDPGPRDGTTSRCAVAPDRKPWPEVVAADLTQGVRRKKPASWALKDAFRRFGLTRFLRKTKAGTQPDLDAYLLVLLADQELTAGRDKQAQALVDAAYTVFDRRAHCHQHRLANQR